MIDIMNIVRREIWKGVNPEGVGAYVKELEETKRELEKLPYSADRMFGIDKRKKEIIDSIDHEIALCRFYFELNRRKKEPNFNEWVFLKKEDRQKALNEYDRWRVRGDSWTKTNGKIRATIDIETPLTMKKITLSIRNDAKNLNFTDTEDIATSNLKSEASINNKIAEYKEKAEMLFAEHQFPRYCYEKRSFDILKELLQVEMEKKKEVEATREGKQEKGDDLTG